MATRSTPVPVGPRRVALRSAALLVVVVLAAQLASWTSGRSALAVDAPTGDAEATIETDPSLYTGDAIDDPAIWVDDADPSRSVVIANDKMGALEVYDLTGRRIQRIAEGFFGNVDVRKGFVTGTGNVDIVVVSRRGIRVYAIDRTTRALSNITDTSTGSIATSIPGEGLCLYRSAASGRTYATTTARDGRVAQYELTDTDGDGRVEGVLRRSWDVGLEVESCVADDDNGAFYISEEDVGIWRYGAEPTDPTGPSSRVQIERTIAAGGRLRPDAEGLTIVKQPGGTGYLIASSQAGSDTLNSYLVYERQGANAFVRSFKVVGGAVTDGCGRTDGIDAVATDLGPAFPHGLFVCQDNTNTSPSVGNQNLKFVPLRARGGPAPTTRPPPPRRTTDDSSTTTTTTDDSSTTTTTDDSSTTTTDDSTTTTSSTTHHDVDEHVTTTRPTTPGAHQPDQPRRVGIRRWQPHLALGGGPGRRCGAGDALLLFFATNTTATVGSPSGVTGWTQVDAVAASSSRSVVWRKIATATDAGRTVTVGVSSISKADLSVVAYRGTSTTNPVAIVSRTTEATGTSHVTPVVTVADSGSWVVSYWMHKDASTTALVPPSGVSVRASGTQTGSGRVTVLVADSGASVGAGSAGGLASHGGGHRDQRTHVDDRAGAGAGVSDTG